jgi:hypothetical protein
VTATCHGLGGTGTQYTYAETEGLWINAGGSKAYAALMAAIATAESGRCSTALNPVDNNGKQSSYGLWQLSNGTHSPPIADPYNGPANARGAVAKFKASGLEPWGTYGSGAYKQYLQGSVPPDLNVKGGGGGSTATLTAATAATSADCLLKLPSASVKTLFGIGPSSGIGGECLVSKSEGRAVAGSLVLVGGGLILGLGAIVLVAFGLKGKTGKKAQQVVSVVPGLPSGGKAAAAAEAVPVAAVA